MGRGLEVGRVFGREQTSVARGVNAQEVGTQRHRGGVTFCAPMLQM